MTALNRDKSSPGPRRRPDDRGWDRRSFLTAALGAAALAPRRRAAHRVRSRRCRPSPTPRDWSGQEPVQYPDPDIVALDPRFRRYIVGNTVDQAAAHRHAVGRGSGVERRRPLSGVERHPEQRPDALD